MLGTSVLMQIQTLWPEAIVVYPQGLNTPTTDHPAGTMPGWKGKAGESGDRDLRLYDAIVATMKQSYAVNTRRIYATGFSNGAVFSLLVWAKRAKTTRGDRRSRRPARRLRGADLAAAVSRHSRTTRRGRTVRGSETDAPTSPATRLLSRYPVQCLRRGPGSPRAWLAGSTPAKVRKSTMRNDDRLRDRHRRRPGRASAHVRVRVALDQTDQDLGDDAAADWAEVSPSACSSASLEHVVPERRALSQPYGLFARDRRASAPGRRSPRRCLPGGQCSRSAGGAGFAAAATVGCVVARDRAERQGEQRRGDLRVDPLVAA